MPLIRGTSMSHYSALVAELGGDPNKLLRAAGIGPADAGRHDAFIPYIGVIRAVEAAAAATHTPDFGRRLGAQQGIEILGPVGVAASSARTVGEAFATFERYLAAYSAAIAARFTPPDETGRTRYEFQILLERIPPHAQTIELSLGVSLRVFRFLIGADYAPVSVHLPHDPLTPRPDYRHYFGCTPRFAERFAGFTMRAGDLQRPLRRDQATHDALVEYLDRVVSGYAPGSVPAVRELVGHMLPTGMLSLDLAASQLAMHPRTLQRRLAEEDTTFAAVVDGVRREIAERCLRDTSMDLRQLTHELGYSEQSVLSRSCRRWFGRTPLAQRKALRAGSVL